jgi:hypothetical protein
VISVGRPGAPLAVPGKKYTEWMDERSRSRSRSRSRECAFVRNVLVFGLLLTARASSPQAEAEPSQADEQPRNLEKRCPACGSAESEAARSAKRDLESAFEIFLTLSDCAGPEHLQSCRDVERLLSSAFSSLKGLVDENGRQDSSGCLSCDTHPVVMPLASALAALGKLLEEKGYQELGSSFGKREEAVERWKDYRCCDAGGTPTPAAPRNREADVRAVLLDKCGSDFVDNRRGLRQVVRMPGDRQGCFQSRACRKASSENGELMEAGFWTYDGEYWYVWAERRTPRGDWMSCTP